ncbi:MAG: hypothetical protein CW691_11745, partial [Candidatus Bathyarchaeum sp.]
MKNFVSLIGLLLILCFSVFIVPEVRVVKADIVVGVIRIMPDGAVEGTDKIQRDGDTYTFTGDVNGVLNTSFGDLSGFLLAMKDNIVIDGAGHTIQCNGTGVGVFLRSMYNITIKNLNIKGFSVGISSYAIDLCPEDVPIQRGRGLNNKIINNTITVVNSTSTMTDKLGGWGIYVEFANNTFVSGNTITAQNPQKGIYCGGGCSNTTLVNNTLTGCGLRLFGVETNTLVGNTIDGKPVVHFDGASNQVIDGAEQVFLVNCSNMTIKNVHPSKSYMIVIQIEKTKNSEIANCKGNIVLTDCVNNLVHDNSPNIIALVSSGCNKVFRNSIVNGDVIFPKLSSDYENARTCIQLYGSDGNEVYENSVVNCNYGIQVGDTRFGESNNNSIYLNNISNAETGIECAYSSNNTVHENNITDCDTGIKLTYADNNGILRNNIKNCGVSVEIYVSNSNSFCSNNFIDNKQHVAEKHDNFFYPEVYYYSVNNTWDNGVTG